MSELSTQSDDQRLSVSERYLARWFQGPTSLVLAVGLYVVSAIYNWNLWPCPDDPETVWASLWAKSYGDVAERSVYTLRMPTYFWIARALAQLFGGGLTGIRIGSELGGLAAVVLAFVVMRAIAPRTYLPLGLALAVGTLTKFAHYYSCARPYALMPALFVLELGGLAFISRGYVRSGLLMVAVGAGLPMQLSAVTIPVSGIAMGIAVLLAWRQRPPAWTWLAFFAVSAATALPAIYKALRLAQQFESTGKSYEFWMAGSPSVYPTTHAILVFVFAGLTLLLRRFGWLRIPSPQLSSSWILGLAGLGLVLVLVNRVAHLELHAPWYWVFEDLVVALLFTVLVQTAVSPRARLWLFVANLALLIVGGATLSKRVTARVGDFRWDQNHDIYAYLLEHAGEHDVIVVTSVWPAAHVPVCYERPVTRELLVSEALLYPGFRRLQPVPGPPAPEATPTPGERSQFWLEFMKPKLANNPRVWFIDKVSLKRFWVDPGESEGLTMLKSVGYRPVDGSVPPRFQGRLLVLERAEPNREDTHAQGERYYEPEPIR